MKPLKYNLQEFEIPIGFNMFNDLKNYFGFDDLSGELKFCKYNYKTGVATFSSKMLPFIYDYLTSRELDTSALTYVKDLIDNIKDDIDTSTPLISIKSEIATITEKSEASLRDYQYDVIKKICRKPYGLIQLYTGWGKNVLISYLTTHYKGDGNILIIVPTKAIAEEIQLRFENFHIKVDDNRVKYVQATGFVASNEFQLKETDKWLSKVGMILMDEGENVSSSIRKILEKCVNVKRLYAFSATSDRFQNKQLSYKALKNHLSELHKETSELIYYFGTTIVHKMPDKVVHVNRTYLQLPIEPIVNRWQQQQAVPIAVKNVIHSSAFLEYIQYIETYYSDKVLFIPIKTIEQGEYLLDFCNQSDYKAVFWSGSGIKSTDNLAKLKITTYEKIKETANNHKLQIIIGSSVAFKGIDISAITDILLVIGTNASVVNQIIGRAYRASEDIRLWLLYNENDRYVDWNKHPEQLSTPVYNACNGARMKQIRNAQKYILQDIDINYPPNKQPTKSLTNLEYEQELLKPQIVKDKAIDKMNNILDKIMVNKFTQ